MLRLLAVDRPNATPSITSRVTPASRPAKTPGQLTRGRELASLRMRSLEVDTVAEPDGPDRDGSLRNVMATV